MDRRPPNLVIGHVLRTQEDVLRVRWRGLREEYHSTSSDVVGAYERENASVSGRVDLLLVSD